MKYNRSEIMQAAWSKYRTHRLLPFAQALRMAWREAKIAVTRYDVYGVNLFGDKQTLLRAGCTDAEAQNVRWMNQYRYDDIVVRIAA